MKQEERRKLVGRRASDRAMGYLTSLNDIGIALSAEKDIDKLLELILDGSKSITHADGGTIYLKTDDNTLEFEIVRTDSLGIMMGGSSGKEISFYPVKLHDENNEPNLHMVAACAVLQNRTINIEDAYDNKEFDFSGTRAFDKKTGYRSKSFLTVPLRNHEDNIIGVLQLLNAIDEISGEIIPFSAQQQKLVESLASQAAVSITTKQLIEAQKKLFESFIELTASAIDDKSPYTGGHCRRVPELTLMLADAVVETTTGPMADFSMNEEERYELKIAGWLHDCGKVTTPEYIVDKATKLETIFDRVNLVDTRFEILKRDAEITLLRARLAHLEGGKDNSDIESELNSIKETLDEERAFIRTCNVGGEFMSEDLQQRISEIAQRQWVDVEGKQVNFLSEDEVYNLHIERGTLTAEEREVINYHIVATIKMLKKLPYPDNLKNVPEFAGGHHERMDGKGYPNGLTRDEMSVQARIMAIADIFEALTASDRPYKKGKTLSEALKILGFFRKDNHIDPDLFDIFMDKKIYLQYAAEFLGDDQIDEVDVSKVPGYVLPEERDA